MLVEQDAVLFFRHCGREELKYGPFPSGKEFYVYYRSANSLGISVFLLTSV